MIVDVTGDGWLSYGGNRVKCALGKGGLSITKVEGDGATPVGNFPLRRVLYRGDRLAEPASKLPIEAIEADGGWCDDPDDPLYNQQVRLPYPGNCEALWREDSLYDVIVVLGYNDDPTVPGKGSAIFLHVAGPDYATTEGCVALKLPDLVELLGVVDNTSVLRVAKT